MINLLNANLNRIRKNKSFFFLLLFCIVFAIYTYLEYPITTELSDNFFQFGLIAGIMIAIFTNAFIGLDYSSGTIRNKITIGHKRINIYFANLIISIISGFIFYGIYFLIIFLLDCQSGAKVVISSKILIKYFSVLFISLISYSCIFTFLSMNISNRVIATFVNISLSILLIILPIESLETVGRYYSYDEMRKHNPDVILSPRPSKQAVQWSKAVLDITPIGHMLQVDEDQDYYTETPILFLYSLGTNIFITGLGIFIFIHKEIK